MAAPPSPTQLACLPAWRRWVVQWDISHLAIALAFFAFTIMWQTLSRHFGVVSVPPAIGYVMYFISCAMLAAAGSIYLLRAFIYPPAVAADFRHPRLSNFFFMPVMIGALCILATPPFMRSRISFVVGFYLLAAYQVGLALYMFGEWLFGASPTGFIHPLVFMQTIGFFLLANIGATSHLVDQADALFSVGILFWLLVFITNFQHLSPALDKRCERPQPTFFLFIAPPAQAAIAFVVIEKARACARDVACSKEELLTFTGTMEWPRLAESFLYVDLFLYMLILRLFPTFWTQKFSFSWWAYIFPLSAAASTTIWRYKAQGTVFWGVLAGLLGLVACIAMLVVSSFTGWAISSGRAPCNPACLGAYYRYYVGSNEDQDMESGFQ